MTRLQIIAASATALARWETRLKVTRVLVSFLKGVRLCTGYRGDQQGNQFTCQNGRHNDLWQAAMT
jgi:phage baseplate assembly protein W